MTAFRIPASLPVARSARHRNVLPQFASAGRLWRVLAGLALAFGWLTPAGAQELPEYRLKAAFLYNFALYTEWPVEVGPTLNLCIYGDDPFGADVDALNGKRVGLRNIVVQRVAKEALNGCHIVFVAQSAIAGSARMLEALRNSSMLTVADSADSARKAVALNMVMGDDKISFEVNLKALGPRLALSSKLLRLARDIQQ